MAPAAATERAVRRRSPRQRRTQAERVAETRLKLLDATLECLAEIGYARMTTADVAERAGLSRGAQLYHFQSKAELVATAVDHLLDRLYAGFMEAVNALAPDVDRAPAMVDLLWQLVNQPNFAAWLELVMAARTDAELAPKVADVENRFASRVAVTFFELFPPPPGTAPSPEHAAAAPLIFSIVVGLVVLRAVPGGPDFSESVLPVVKPMTERFLP
jgi:AcrR family transcriptional regulator